MWRTTERQKTLCYDLWQINMEDHSVATVNRQSLRQEAERIQTEFQHLSADKKINAESTILFESMVMLINLLVAIFLEKTTTKNNKNSRKPSSQTEKDESSTTNQGTNGKGKTELDGTASNTRTIETVTTIEVTNCDACGEDLTYIDCEYLAVVMSRVLG